MYILRWKAGWEDILFGRYYEKKNNIEIITDKTRNKNMVIISSNNLDHYPKVGIYDNIVNKWE